MKYTDLRKKIHSGVFTLQDLRMLDLKVISYQLSLWQKQGHIVKLKNGIYIFEDRVSGALPEEIASILYSPSYISLEKALSIYNLIPEMVYAITCVTPKITRSFKNRLGSFNYRHIKSTLFFGYKEIGNGKHKYLLAEPEKALLDFVYFNLKNMKSEEDIAAFRFNTENIKKAISQSKLKKYLKLYKAGQMEKIIHWVLKGK